MRIRDNPVVHRHIRTVLAIDPTSTTSEDTNGLRFQSKEALTQADPSTRVIAWPDYRQSDYSADKLSWKVDELFSSKEVLLVGSAPLLSANNTHRYSLRNGECEHDRMFEVQVA